MVKTIISLEEMDGGLETAFMVCVVGEKAGLGLHDE